MQIDFLNLKSRAIICAEIESIHSLIEQNIDPKRVKCFYFDSIKIEDVRAIIKEAYIKDNEYKYLAISSSSYSVVVQNALLKILEEPPSGVYFLLIAKSKSALLATVKSRLTTHQIPTQKKELNLELNLKNLTMSEIFGFIKAHERVPKEELFSITQEIIKLSVTKHLIDFTQKEYEVFDSLYRLIELNTRASTILTTLLLTIYDRRYK